MDDGDDDDIKIEDFVIPDSPMFEMSSSSSESDSLSPPPFDGFEDDDGEDVDVIGDGDGEEKRLRRSGRRSSSPPDTDNVYLNEISDILDGEFSKMERE